MAMTVFVAACTTPSSFEGCTEEARPALIIDVVDNATGQPVTEGLSGRVWDGDFTRGLAAPPGTGTLSGPSERPGVYDVAIHADGFRSDTLRAIRVSADECHVITEERTVRLIR